MYKLKIVLRLLRKRKITIFPIAGVALGVMALVVVLSIMQGFETDFRARIRAISPDISLNFTRTDGFTGDTDELLAALEAIAQVSDVSPFISALGLAEIRVPSEENPLEQYVYDDYVAVRGFDFEREQEVLNLGLYLQHGKDYFSEHPYTRDGSTSPVFIIGSRFAGKKHRDLRVEGTDWGNVPQNARAQVTTLTPEYEVGRVTGTVCDVVASGIWDIDQHLLFMPLDWARALRRMPPGSITGVGIKLHDYNSANATAAKKAISTALEEVAPFTPYVLTTWEESRGTFLIAVAMERRIMAFILFFFLVVAGFSIAAILIMIVLEKVRDIGILRAMGASSRGVAGMFLLYGMLIAFIGAALGLTAGVLFVENLDSIEFWIYDMTGWQPFPPEVYDLPAIPRILNWPTNIIVVAAALAVSFLASLLPAVRAAWLDPVEAIHYE